jgi:hypothetical protein
MKTIANWKPGVRLVTVFVMFAGSALAKCPVTGNPEVVVWAPVGNLTVDTTGTDAVEFESAGRQPAPVEKCSAGLISLEWKVEGTGSADWRIRVPKSVTLDLTSPGGTITIGDSDGKVTLRTGGGKVTAGNIKGDTAIVTQGGPIRTGNIGGKVELRSAGGDLTVGNVEGEAELVTQVGQIRAGIVHGRVSAKTSGGNITIKEAHGDVIVETNAGNIIIGDARKMIQANTGGGDIENDRVQGGFKGSTENGNVTIRQADSWVEVRSGGGDIYVKLVPTRMDSDIHVSLTTALGNVTLYVPQNMRGNVESIVDRQPMNSQRVFSDIPGLKNSLVPRGSGPSSPPPNLPSKFVFPSGGGSPISLHTSLGNINILKW